MTNSIPTLEMMMPRGTVYIETCPNHQKRCRLTTAAVMTALVSVFSAEVAPSDLPCSADPCSSSLPTFCALPFSVRCISVGPPAGPAVLLLFPAQHYILGNSCTFRVVKK